MHHLLPKADAGSTPAKATGRTRRLLALSALLGGVAAALPASAQTVYGLSNTGNTLVSFSVTAPATVTTIGAITGLGTGQTLVGLDSRPNTGELFALGYDATVAAPTANAQLYRLNLTTGAATAVGTASRLELGTNLYGIGFDFNPTVDRIRVVSTNRANYRLNPNNGAIAATDGTLTYATGDASASLTPGVGAAAYTNSYIGAAATELYVLDEVNARLALQNPPNNGTLNTRADLTTLLGTGAPSATRNADFDIYTSGGSGSGSSVVNTAYGVTTSANGSSFFTLNLTTGAATPVGTVGSGTAGAVRDIAVGINRTLPTLTGPLVYATQVFGTAPAINQNLLSFDASAPTFIRSLVPVTGLLTDQLLVGTDFRPNTGQLFGLGYNAANGESRLYTIDRNTGVATPVGTANVTLALGGTADNISFDFNPTVDRIRVVSTNRANYRLNPNNGTIAATDGTLTFASTDANASRTPRIGAVAYTNSYIGATSTTLYDFDETLNVLTTQIPPNNGTLNTVGMDLPLGITATNALVDLDITFNATLQQNITYLTANPNGQANSNLYTLNLTTASPTLVGTIGMGVPVRDIAVLINRDNIPPIAGGLLYGIASGNLVSFGSSNPEVLRTAVNLTGLPATQVLVGLDFRPANGQLYALGYATDATAPTVNAQLYTIDLTTGALTAVGTAQRYELGGSTERIGFDFNPTVDRIRIVSTNGTNLRVNPADGVATVDGNITGPSTTAPRLSAVAYSNTTVGTTTTLYGYDESSNFVLQASNPNAGTYANLGVRSGRTVNTNGVDFDIFTDNTTGNNSGFLVAGTTGSAIDSLYSVSLTTGALTPVGRIGSGSNLTGFAAFLNARVSAVVPAALAQLASIYPNPAHGTATLVLPTALRGTQATTVQVLDNLGRVVLTRTLAAGASQTMELPLSGLSAGIYLVQAHTPAGVVSKRLAVQQ